MVEFYTGLRGCKNVTRELFNFPSVGGAEGGGEGEGEGDAGFTSADDLDMVLWNYQACTQLPMMPLSTDYLGMQNRDPTQHTHTHTHTQLMLFLNAHTNKIRIINTHSD